MKDEFYLESEAFDELDNLITGNSAENTELTKLLMRKPRWESAPKKENDYDN